MRSPLRRGWLAALLFLFLAMALSLGVVGCSFDDAPDLLTVHRLDPNRASAGDHLLVTGEGFPEGRPATVTFRGEVARPGLPTEHEVRVSARTVPAGRNVLRLVFDPALERRFLRGASHATFHGDLRVSFAPGASGLASVAGSAHGVRFDVLLSVGDVLADGADSSDADVLDGLAFLGIAPAPVDPGVSGVRVAEVDPEGRAAMAGVRKGDLLVDFDGVTVLGTEDVRAHAGQRLARVIVERDGKLLPPLPVDVVGLSELTASDFIAAAAMILLVCTAMMLPATRVGVVLRWLERLSDERRRRRGTRLDASRTAPELVLSLLQDTRRVTVTAAALVLAGIVACFVLLSTGRSLVSPELDLMLLAFVATVPLVLLRALHGGSRGRGFSLTSAFAATLKTLACVVPALLAIGGAVLAGGRFVIGEMVFDQGGAPWRWAAMQNPGLFCLALVLVLSAAPEAGSQRLDLPLEPHADTLRQRGDRARGPAVTLLRLAEWAYLWIVCGLAVVLFLGGWRVPFLAAWSGETRAWLAVGALLFVGKLVLTVCAVGALRHLSSGVFVEHIALIAMRWVAPAAAMALVLALAWAAALDGARSRMAAEGAGYALAGFSLILAVHAARLAWARRAPPVTAVNPWL